MTFAHKIRVGVLRGGPSPEYEVSLKTGQNILANMPDQYEPVDIFISKEGSWHTRGLQKDPYNILKTVDVIINATHGTYGEDGQLQRFIEHFNIPYTGSGPMASAICMNKVAAKKIFSEHNLKVPNHIIIREDENNIADRINDNFLLPIIVKPISSGSSLGVSFINKRHKIEEALKESFKHSSDLMAEEFIKGKEATCGVIEGFRGRDYYALMPIEIRHRKDLFDYDAKYSDQGAEEICPGNFSEAETREIERMAIQAHQSLGLRHYSRSDFIIHPKRGIFILETNSLPGLTEKSLIPKALKAVGGDIKEFISHLLSRVLHK